MIYPMISVGKWYPYSMLLKHSINGIASGPPSLFRGHLDLPQRLAKFPVTLVPFSTWELLYKGWRPPRPPHKAVVTAPHQSGGLMTCRRATKAPRGRHTEVQAWAALKRSTQGTQSCSYTLTRVNLALTLSRMCYGLKMWSLCNWMAWRCCSMCTRSP
jgi:hypothetical protein